MAVCYSALLALLALPITITASEVSFSYNPDSPVGPSNWGTLAIDNNQCSGQKNSPIAVNTSPCDVKKDYTLLVRKAIHEKSASNIIQFFSPNLTVRQLLCIKNRTEIAPSMT